MYKVILLSSERFLMMNTKLHTQLQLTEMILFVSSSSAHSLSTIVEMDRMNMQISFMKIVTLDTQEIRNIVRKGKHFSITHVPTLAAIHVNGVIHIYTGKERILTYLSALTGIPYEPFRVKTEKHIVEDTNYEQISKENSDEEEIVPEYSEEEEPQKKPEKKPQRRRSKQAKKPKIIEAKRKESPMKNVMEQAERMRKQREKELGVDDEDC